jgi:hypothetical protein
VPGQSRRRAMLPFPRCRPDTSCRGQGDVTSPAQSLLHGSPSVASATRGGVLRGLVRPGSGMKSASSADAQPRQLPPRRLHARVFEVVHREPCAQRGDGQAQGRACAQRQRPRPAEQVVRQGGGRCHQQHPRRGAKGDRHAGERERAAERCAPATGPR